MKRRCIVRTVQFDRSIRDVPAARMSGEPITERFDIDFTEPGAYRLLGSLTNPSDRLLDLDIEELSAHEEELPIFVVNACHSGRLHRVGDEAGLHGFPKDFMAYVARGYLGTLGPVEHSYASELGAGILRRARESEEGISVSRLLREMREEVARDHDLRRSSPDDLLRLLFTFMYVYYGNPLLSLRLRPSVAGGEV